MLHSLWLGNLIKCLKLFRKKIKNFRIASWYHNDTFVIYHWESTIHLDAFRQHQVRWKIRNSFYVLEMILAIQITDWIHLIHFDQFQYFKKSFKMTNSLSFYGSQNVCAGPNFLSQLKNLTAFSASSKTFVQAKKAILLHSNHLLVWHKMVVTGTICR